MHVHISKARKSFVKRNYDLIAIIQLFQKKFKKSNFFYLKKIMVFNNPGGKYCTSSTPYILYRYLFYVSSGLALS